MDKPKQQKTTHFGYHDVPWEEKVNKVADVFHSVANHYDLMNDLMSLGVHRLWKRFTLQLVNAKSGDKILDVAGGTGDLTKVFADQVTEKGQVILADINASMLQQGRDRLINAGYANTINYIQANAQCLPFPDNYFSIVTIAFGLRNVTDKAAALASMYRVLKPGGRLFVLEFSKPTLPGLQPIYDAYSFAVLPRLGEWVAGGKKSYEYLAESIRMHPNQHDLKKMILEAGFDACDYFNLSGGIVALHRAYKY